MNVFGLGPGELILVLTLALVVFGPRKLPEIGAGLGKAVGQFRKATNDLTQEINREMQSEGLKDLASLKDVPRDLRGVANSLYEASTRPVPPAAAPTQAQPAGEVAEQPQTAVAANEAAPTVAETEPAAVTEIAHTPPGELASPPNGAPRRLRIREAEDMPSPAPDTESGH